MSAKISELNLLSNPSLTAVFPVVVGGATRRATIQDLLGTVTGGTVTSLQGIGNIKTSPSPLTTSGSVYFNLPGMIISYAGGSAPSGWVFCNGQEYSKIDPIYSSLYAVIGTTYGSGTGTFKVPDLRGRTPFGVASSSSEVNKLTGVTVSPNLYTLGAVGGAETHTLTPSQTAIRAHTHSGSGKRRVYGNTYRTDSNGSCSPPGNFSDYGYVGNITEGFASNTDGRFHSEVTTNTLSSSVDPYSQTISPRSSSLTDQSITWIQSLPDINFTSVPIPLTATASSSLPVTFSVHSGPATLSGNNLTITGVGIIVVEAYQSGNASYNPVYQARSFRVNHLPHNNVPPAIVLNYIIKV